jgi:hypothetical protein
MSAHTAPNTPVADNQDNDAPTIAMPTEGDLSDACMLDLDTIEYRFYARHSMYAFKLQEWFHVAVIKRLFAEIRFLKSTIECNEYEQSRSNITNDILDAILQLKRSPTVSSTGYVSSAPKATTHAGDSTNFFDSPLSTKSQIKKRRIDSLSQPPNPNNSACNSVDPSPATNQMFSKRTNE